MLEKNYTVLIALLLSRKASQEECNAIALQLRSPSISLQVTPGLKGIIDLSLARPLIFESYLYFKVTLAPGWWGMSVSEQITALTNYVQFSTNSRSISFRMTDGSAISVLDVISPNSRLMPHFTDHCVINPDQLVHYASRFAEMHHSRIDQKRKFTNEPYINHSREVANIVSSVPYATPAMIAAALLHDVSEDCDVSSREIRDWFGGDVARLVSELTNVGDRNHTTRADRIALDREHSASSSAEAQTIKLADIISNTRDIIEVSPEFSEIYLPEKALLVDALTKGDDTLRQIATEQIQSGLDKLSKIRLSTRC